MPESDSFVSASSVTLQEIADACGFTRSLLSKIENGRTVPPVATLVKIAAALGVKASALLDEDQGPRTVLHQAADVDHGPLITTDRGYQFFAFAPNRSNKQMQPFLFVARRGEVKRHTLTHAGEEFIYVLQGEMRYRVGATEYRLGQGDALYFDSEEEHSIEPLSDEVRYIGVFVEPQTSEPQIPTASADAPAPTTADRRAPRKKARQKG